VGLEERSGKTGAKSDIPLDEMVCRGFPRAPFKDAAENVVECIIADPPYAELGFYETEYIRAFLSAVDKIGKSAPKVSVAKGCYCLWFGEIAILGNTILYNSLL
jgi:hypothetical protein